MVKPDNKGVASREWDSLVIFYYFSTSLALLEVTTVQYYTVL